MYLKNTSYPVLVYSSIGRSIKTRRNRKYRTPHVSGCYLFKSYQSPPYFSNKLHIHYTYMYNIPINGNTTQNRENLVHIRILLFKHNTQQFCLLSCLRNSGMTLHAEQLNRYWKAFKYASLDVTLTMRCTLENLLAVNCNKLFWEPQFRNLGTANSGILNYFGNSVLVNLNTIG